jgi:hypothetical protein
VGNILKEESMNKEIQIQKPDFDDFTTEELFDYLQDLYIIDPDDTYEQWKHLKDHMLDLCKYIYKNQLNEK